MSSWKTGYSNTLNFWQYSVYFTYTLREWFEAIETFTSHTVTPLEVVGRGDLAYAMVRSTFTVVLKNGASVSDESTGLNILRKKADGSWLISPMVWNSNLQPME